MPSSVQNLRSSPLDVPEILDPWHLSRAVFKAYAAREQDTKKLESCVFISIVGKPHCKELLLTSVSKGGLQIVCPIICVSQSQADI